MQMEEKFLQARFMLLCSGQLSDGSRTGTNMAAVPHLLKHGVLLSTFSLSAPFTANLTGFFNAQTNCTCKKPNAGYADLFWMF